MENKSIPTVEEFIILKGVFDGILYSPLHKREFKLSELLHEYAVLFARYHVRECKESIYNNVEPDWKGNLSCAAINDAYDEDNIK